MKIIYTHNTYNGTKPLANETDKELFRKMARLSVESAAAQFEHVICYTDDVAAVKAMGLPFTKIVYFDFSGKFPTISPKWWNMAKLITYALQHEPNWLHIDWDVYLLPGFAESIQKADIITEMLRPYNVSPAFMRNAPKWYKKQKPRFVPGKLICSGLLGSCSSKPTFHNLLSYALQAAAKNNYPTVHDLYAIEEYNLSLIAERESLSISALDKTLYRHWQGKNKAVLYGNEINELYSKHYE